MSERPGSITSKDISDLPRGEGFVLDFSGIALSETAGHSYVPMGLTQTGQITDDPRRAAISAPKLIARYSRPSLETMPDLSLEPGMSIKERGDMHLTLPTALQPFLEHSDICARDALELYGAERFQDLEMGLTLRRGDILLDQAHRQDFAHWHDHTDWERNTDFTFGFLTGHGTEFENGWIQPDFSIARFGGEEKHRSRPNLTGQVLRREWGAITVYADEPTSSRHLQNATENKARFDERAQVIQPGHPLFEENKMRAAKVLAAGRNIRVLETPQTLIEHAGVEVRYTEEDFAL